MTASTIRLAGVELYFDGLAAAKNFYTNALGLRCDEDNPDHHIKLSIGDRFICLERKGVENYPSADKAVLFLEVPDVRVAVERVGVACVLRSELTVAEPWAAVRDPEGHTIVLIQHASPPIA